MHIGSRCHGDYQIDICYQYVNHLKNLLNNFAIVYSSIILLLYKIYYIFRLVFFVMNIELFFGILIMWIDVLKAINQQECCRTHFLLSPRLRPWHNEQPQDIHPI